VSARSDPMMGTRHQGGEERGEGDAKASLETMDGRKVSWRHVASRATVYGLAGHQRTALVSRRATAELTFSRH